MSPWKSVSGRAWAFQVNESAGARAGGRLRSAAPGARYQDRALVPGMGNLDHDCSKAGLGSPAMGPPAPLSKRTRIGASCSNAVNAPE